MPAVSLRAKLLLGVLVILTPILGLLLYGAHEEHVRQRAAVLDDLTRTSQTVAVLADASFDDALALAQLLASDPVIQTLDPAVVDPKLQRVARSYSQVSNVVVVDAAGDEVGAAIRQPGASPVNVADRPYFQQVMATGAPAISGVLVGRILLQPIATAAAPLPARSGRPAGMVLVGLKLDALAGRLQSVGLPPGQAIFLADPTGRLAFHTAQPELSWEARDVSSWPEVQAALAGRVVRTADFHSPVLGDVRAAALVLSPRHGWLVGVTCPVAEAFGPLEARFRLQLLAFGTIALLAALAAVLLAAYLAGPVQRLAVQAQALGRGALHHRVDIKTGDELEALGVAFNRMAADLEAGREGRQQFLSAVAHDLRGPVTVIRGYTALLRRGGGQDPERREKALQSIDDATERLERMVGDLLEASRVAAGRFEVRPGPMDLVALVGQLVEAHQHTTLEHRLTLAGPPRLEGCWDRDRLAQVVGNLLGNAAKYSPEGGEIRVAVEPLDGEVHLSVSDQGVGLRPEDLPRVFEPFERLEETRNLEGAGLGLFICKGIVEAHGGRIWAESPGLDQGSTFHVVLPRPIP
ncbi:MAG: sensor histidine kinase [Chloroflexi bacterium]|nr:sensor histidine kinase [Chloroflexota bacterium]